MDILIKLIVVYAVIGFIFALICSALLMLAVKLAKTNDSTSKVVGSASKVVNIVNVVANMEKCSFRTAAAMMLTSFFLKWPHYVLVVVKGMSNNGGTNG